MSRLLGLDVGGTRSRARLDVDGSTAAEVEGPSASPVAAGAGAAAALDGLLSRLPLDGSVPLDAACAGAAGLSAPGARRLFEQRLGRLAAGGPVVVVDDGLLVLPAAGIGDGIGVVCGTGAAAYGKRGATVVRAGGWGYLLGDEGGGYALVRAAARVVLGRLDRGAPPGPLGADLAAACGGGDPDRLLERLYADPAPRAWAALAPSVLDSPDPAVDGVLAGAAAAVGELARLAALRLGGGPLPVVLAGGVTSHPRYRSVVLGELRRASPVPVGVLDAPPVSGAVRLAAEAAGA